MHLGFETKVGLTMFTVAPTLLLVIGLAIRTIFVATRVTIELELIDGVGLLDPEDEPFGDSKDVTRFKGALKEADVHVLGDHEIDGCARHGDDNATVSGDSAGSQQGAAIEKRDDPVTRQYERVSVRTYGAPVEVVAQDTGERSVMAHRLKCLNGRNDALDEASPHKCVRSTWYHPGHTRRPTARRTDGGLRRPGLGSGLLTV